VVNGGNKDAVDLMVLGEILVKHYLYLKSRADKEVFLGEVTQRFYVSPMTKFGDEMKTFKDVIEGNSTTYNDALLFVMAVCADLITPEAYFQKMLEQYGKVIESFTNKDPLRVSLRKENHFECVFFALRFFIDQLDLIAPEPIQAPKTEEKEDGK